MSRDFRWLEKFNLLLEKNYITEKTLDKAVNIAEQKAESLEHVLINYFKVPKQEIGLSLSRFYNVKFIEYSPTMPIPGELFTNLKVSFLKENSWVPLNSHGDIVSIAIDNPGDFQKISDIKALMPGKKIKLCIALKEDILALINLFTSGEKHTDLTASTSSEKFGDKITLKTGPSEEDRAVVKIVNKIIMDAYARRASDIHIEPYPANQMVQIRIRVDGVCALHSTIPYDYSGPIISRIKIMADLDISERRKPQDGKIRFKKYGGKDIELRVVTLPTQGGVEDIVIRILPEGKPIPLEKLGLTEINYEKFVNAITRPHGIILLCGPTGSGKTTSLHSALGYINSSEIKIWTAEDPVEITQEGLRQVQVIPKIGFNFASAMRSFLRADPDVIMVGEMRDNETASIAIEASLTGHLVFSTLHTNSAPESITRLLEIGMDRFNFADAIVCILAQRLARTLCKDCKETYHPSIEEFQTLVRIYGSESFEKNLNIKYTDNLTLNRPKGCENCNYSGYLGRQGIHELLIGTEKIRSKIRANNSMKTIRLQAISDGMRTLAQDGIEKIFSGSLDFIQVRRVCI